MLKHKHDFKEHVCNIIIPVSDKYIRLPFLKARMRHKTLLLRYLTGGCRKIKTIYSRWIGESVTLLVININIGDRLPKLLVMARSYARCGVSFDLMG